ncbi:MAG: winged helix-turn-helix domain-containing protein [Sneathiella sp.]
MPQRETGLDNYRPPALKASDEPQYLRFDNLVIDLQAYRVGRDGRIIELGPVEYRMLCFFLRHPSKVFTREELIDGVWPTGTEIDMRTVDVHIARLRRSLTRYGHADPIRTVRTVGYALG